MTTRRSLLCAGVLGIATTAPSRVRATTEVEGAEYAGTTAGGWTCGPTGRANYGGIGARVRVADEPARFGGAGWTGEIAAAGEHEAVTVYACRADCGTQGNPPARILLGGHARAGYQGRYVGIEAGGTAFQGWADSSDRTPSGALFPDVELRLGPRDDARFVIGVGSPLVTMLRRPGGYVGMDVATGPMDLEMRFGDYRAGPALFDDGSTRFDVVGLVPISDRLKLRLGASASGNDVGPGGEGSVGLSGSL